MTKSNKSIISLHNCNSKVFSGRRGGDTSSSESRERRHYNGITRRIQQAAVDRQLMADMAEVTPVLLAGHFNDRPSSVVSPDEPLFGLSDVVRDLEVDRRGNQVRFDHDGGSVSLVVDSSGRMLSAHCKSW